MNHYGFIMAGGGGTRFWPLSRQKTPKQLLNLSGKDIMVNEAIDRLATVIEKNSIFIVTSEMQAPAMRGVTGGRVLPENILAEPSARNTAACIGYAAMEIICKYGDGVMVIVPADHNIKNVPALTEIFETAVKTAEIEDKLVTIGIQPSFPSTGFGYIRFDKSNPARVKPVISFKEKPDESTAARYLASGEYVWNSGMFIWKASLILSRLKKYCPDIYEELALIGNAMCTPDEIRVLHNVYPGIRKVSIDYAVMEPSALEGDVLVIPGDCEWNDVGSWDMMNVLHTPDENNNVVIGDVLTLNVQNSVIYSSSRIITAVDVDNIVIVETSDSVMVCRKDKAQNVKQIVDALNEAGRKELL